MALHQSGSLLPKVNSCYWGESLTSVFLVLLDVYIVYKYWIKTPGPSKEAENNSFGAGPKV